MHTIHHTEGFILKSVNFAEANKYFFVLTRDFGLIKVLAQGVRHLKSKLRYNLADYSFVHLSLVRGQEVWRLTAVEQKLILNDSEKLLLFARICSLLLRLLHGEEKNSLLYEYLQSGFNFLQLSKIAEEKMANLECILALRILSALGYIGQTPNFSEFTVSPYLSEELVIKMSNLKSCAILEINKSLKETHL